MCIDFSRERINYKRIFMVLLGDKRLQLKAKVFESRSASKYRLVLLVSGFICLIIVRAVEKEFGISLGYLYVTLISLAGFWFGIWGGIIASIVAFSIFIVEVTILEQWGKQTFALQSLSLRALVYFLGGVTFGYFSHIEKNIKKKLEREIEIKTRELISTQEKLLRSERLAAMGETGGIIAHELKNYLGAMSNVAYFLKMKLKDTDETIQEKVHILDTQLARTNKIIENILSFSRMKQPQLRTVKTKDFFHALVNKIKSEKPKGIEIIIRIDEHIPDIYADEMQLTQVCDNLILNAIEAMGTHGTLRITVTSQKDFVYIIFEDTGSGIKDEIKEKIFEPLFSTKESGTGFGLATVRRLVTSHGGTVSVESEGGKGARFIVKMPIKNKKFFM